MTDKRTVLVMFGSFLSLRVGIYAAGTGEVRLRDFRYSTAIA